MVNVLSYWRLRGGLSTADAGRENCTLLYRAFLGALDKLFHPYDRIAGDTQVAIPPGPAHLAEILQGLVLCLHSCLPVY